jgi:hypothetical protein
MMPRLQFPDASFSFREEGQRKLIYDIIRKKYVVLTPEEWVRQHVLHYVIGLGYPPGLIAVERALRVNTLSQRADVVVYNRKGAAVLIIECKSADVEITQGVFDQVARYNMPLQVKWLMVTNGLQHFICEMNYTEKSYRFVPSLPEADVLLTS